MKVSELIEYLKTMVPDANVLVCTERPGGDGAYEAKCVYPIQGGVVIDSEPLED